MGAATSPRRPKAASIASMAMSSSQAPALRNKIDRDYPVKLIHTLRGIGYVLRLPEDTGR